MKPEDIKAIAEATAAIVIKNLRLPQHEWLTIMEAAEVLRCSRDKVENLINAGRLVTNGLLRKEKRISRGSVKRYQGNN